ncbi:hypothetical protein JCM19237_335 [Photobacterium aphoticum]|uniref:Uncharacterized protein n=1 Tax=Photobacterium aphoticum TaxID=754436 RepID=A0A090QXN9_9GAMM|nr:hypothetical protein JCM19237_335 [Photobacterium aphoticum]
MPLTRQIIIRDGNQAKLENIREWLSTPEGTIYGRPDWGHPLDQFRHEPQSPSTALAIENTLLLKLASDLPDVTLSRILVSPMGKDGYYIGFGVPEGVIEEVKAL